MAAGEFMIDPKTIQDLEKLQGIGEESLLRRLIEMFLKTAAERVNSMKSCVDNLNRLQLRADAHALKSSAFRLGASDLAHLCQKLENLIESAGGASEIKDLVKRLESTHTETAKELKEILASHT